MEETNTQRAEEQPEVIVRSNGNGGLNAEVQTVDPMADTVVSAAVPQEEPADVEEDIQKQQRAEADVKTDLASKGVDFDALAAEYDSKGELSTESLAALNKAGYPQSVVDAYLNGMQATAAQFVSQVQQFAGGKEAYTQLASFIQTQPKAVIDAFNASIQSGNLGQIQLAIGGLRAQMTAKYGTSNPTVMGGVAESASAKGYTAISQMTKDMSDPRYQTDPVFTREVVQKLRNGSIF